MDDWTSDQAPTDWVEFQAACNALRRNDDAVTRFTNKFLYDQLEYSDVDGYGRQLGNALLQGDNSVVVSLELNLSGFLTHMEKRRFQDGDILNGNHPFLQWMRQARNLKKVKFYTGYLNSNVSRSEYAIHVQLKHYILLAMSQNPVICKFKSSKTYFPNLHDATYIRNARECLTSLKLVVKDGSNYIEDAARAIGTISNLQVLRLDAADPEPFLRHLQGTTTLRDFTMNFKNYRTPSVGTVGLLCDVWRNNSNQLQFVTLTDLELDSDLWDHIESALRSTKSIEHLVLRRCPFDSIRKRVRAFFKLSDAAVQPVRFLTLDSSPLEEDARTLRLIELRFDPKRLGKKAADMLCGSLLRHFELNVDDFLGHGTLTRAHVPGFFSTLRENTSQVRLQSLKLVGVDNDVLDHLSTFLPKTDHLRELVVEPGVYDVDWSGRLQTRATFLSAVRRNGSLHKLTFTGLPVELERRISAYTERNRCLPKLMASLGPVDKKGNAVANAPSQLVLDSEPDKPPQQQQEPHKTINTNLFPVLSRAALDMERMEPKMLFLGLLNACDETMPTAVLTDKNGVDQIVTRLPVVKPMSWTMPY